jgi:hypothetical protein
MTSVEDFSHLKMLQEREAIGGPISENNSRVVVRDNLTPLEQEYRDYWRANVSPNDIGCTRPDPSRPELHIWTHYCCDHISYRWEGKVQRGLPNEQASKDFFAQAGERFASIAPGTHSLRVEAEDFTEAEKKFTEAILATDGTVEYGGISRYADGDFFGESVRFAHGINALFYYPKR